MQCLGAGTRASYDMRHACRLDFHATNTLLSQWTQPVSQAYKRKDLARSMLEKLQNAHSASRLTLPLSTEAKGYGMPPAHQSRKEHV